MNIDLSKKQAVCLITEYKGRLMMVSRKDNHAILGLPGGKIDPSDITIKDALQREVFEETGYEVVLSSLKLLYVGDCNGYETFTYFGKLHQTPPAPTDMSETGTITFGYIKHLLMNNIFLSYNIKVIEQLILKYPDTYNKIKGSI